MANLTKVVLYVDGACSIKGPRAECGGWATIILFGDRPEEIRAGHAYPSTNQRMELQALLSGLMALPRPCQVDFYSDSEYVVQGVNDWLDRWKKRNWRNAAGKRIINKDLWEKIAAYKHMHILKGHWVRGHVPAYKQNHHHQQQDRCDKLAVEQAFIAQSIYLTPLAEPS